MSLKSWLFQSVFKLQLSRAKPLWTSSGLGVTAEVLIAFLSTPQKHKLWFLVILNMRSAALRAFFCVHIRVCVYAFFGWFFFFIT